MAHICANCQAVPKPGKPFNECAGCHETHYCSRDCQIEAWPKHKSQCKQLEYVARSNIDGAVTNPMLISFMMALLSRFEVFGMLIGFIKCTIYRHPEMVGDEVYYDGFITYIKGKSHHMEKGKNLMLLEHTYHGRVYEKVMLCTPHQCSENLDEFKRFGLDLFKIKANQSLEFRANNKFYFDLGVIDGLKKNGGRTFFNVIDDEVDKDTVY